MAAYEPVHLLVKHLEKAKDSGFAIAGAGGDGEPGLLFHDRAQGPALQGSVFNGSKHERVVEDVEDVGI